MSGRKKGPKASIHGAKPEPPPFIARMREQIVANEDVERRERSEKRRRERGDHGRNSLHDEEDDPTIVRVDQDDLTEEEYKRIKLALETQYKLEEDNKGPPGVELDIDTLIGSREAGTTGGGGNRSRNEPEASSSKQETRCGAKVAKKEAKSGKSLSYGSSSEEE